MCDDFDQNSKVNFDEKLNNVGFHLVFTEDTWLLK
jgi:hypothetical protein